MATSSIFTNVKITDRHSAETFISALEKASKSPQRVPTTTVNAPLRDKEAIRALFAKRLGNKKWISSCEIFRNRHDGISLNSKNDIPRKIKYIQLFRFI